MDGNDPTPKGPTAQQGPEPEIGPSAPKEEIGLTSPETPPSNEAPAPQVVPSPAHVPIQQAAFYLPPVMAPGIIPAPFIAQQMVTAQFRSSPFPPSQELEVMERLYPGATKRIFDLVEQRQTAEIDLAKSGQQFQRDDTRRGNWMGWTVILFVVITAAALFYTGHPLGGSALLVADVLGVGGALYMQSPDIFKLMKPSVPQPSLQPIAPASDNAPVATSTPKNEDVSRTS